MQARLRGRSMGVLTQASGLVEHLDVLGNLRLAASFRPTVWRTTELVALLEAVGLGSRVSARPSTLSGGETGRANLAVALAGGPTLLLADEPTAEVSRPEEAALLDLLRELRPPDGGAVLRDALRRGGQVRGPGRAARRREGPVTVPGAAAYWWRTGCGSASGQHRC